MAYSFINNRRFVKAWMTSQYVSDVAEKLGLTKLQVTSKAGSLRNKGVNLPPKPRQFDTDSVEQLNKIIESFQEK